MPTCPRCNTEIDHLEAITAEYFRYVVRLPAVEEEKNDPDYDPDFGLLWVEDTIETPVEDSFVCPACRQELTKDEEEAARILKGGKQCQT